jgi:predicted RNA-binding Zn ribbon-like protein
MEMTPYRTWAVDVDGLKLPAPLGGHPVLDFCNTFAGWDDPEHGDYLRTYDHLAVFAAAWDLIDDDVAAELRVVAEARPGAARGALEAARDLRESIYRTLVQPQPGAELDHVAEAIRRSFDASDLVVEGGRPAWRLDASAGLRVPVHAVARAAAGFLTSPDAAGVGRCPGQGCGWLFLDRGGRRRWCTMSTCGNRAKARRFAERHRASPGARR